MYFFFFLMKCIVGSCKSQCRIFCILTMFLQKLSAKNLPNNISFLIFLLMIKMQEGVLHQGSATAISQT